MYWCSGFITTWCTQLLAAYISHCLGLGAPRRLCVPFSPRQLLKKPMPEPGAVS